MPASDVATVPSEKDRDEQAAADPAQLRIARASRDVASCDMFANGRGEAYHNDRGGKFEIHKHEMAISRNYTARLASLFGAGAMRAR